MPPLLVCAKHLYRGVMFIAAQYKMCCICVTCGWTCFKAITLHTLVHMCHDSNLPASARLLFQPRLVCSFGAAQQAPMLQGGQSPIPRSIFPSQKTAFGSPFPALPPSMQLASSSHAQQALLPHPASPQGHASQQTASPQQASGPAAKQSPAGTSSAPTAASMDASGSASGQSARQDSTAAYWTPMKASADLPHQALVDKVTKGKQLLPNSLIGAGLDPARLASTPRPQGPRRFQGQHHQKHIAKHAVACIAHSILAQACLSLGSNARC